MVVNLLPDPACNYDMGTTKIDPAMHSRHTKLPLGKRLAPYRNLESVVCLRTTIPQQEGVLFESRGRIAHPQPQPQHGTLLGIFERSGTLRFRLTSGDSVDVGESTDADTAVIDHELSSFVAPNSGEHDICIFLSPYNGLVELYLDGVRKGQAQCHNQAFPSNAWTGDGYSSYGGIPVSMFRTGPMWAGRISSFRVWTESGVQDVFQCEGIQRIASACAVQVHCTVFVATY